LPLLRFSRRRAPLPGSTPATGFRPIAWAGYSRDIETIGYKALRNPGPTVDELSGASSGNFPTRPGCNPAPLAVGTVVQATVSRPLTPV
jgi:hypothetical protein